MIKNYFCIFIILLSFEFANAQQNNDVSCDTTNADYVQTKTTIKTLYSKMLDSEISVKYCRLSKEFHDKVNYDGTSQYDLGSGIGMNLIKDWIVENMHKTDFKTYQEAEAAIKEIEDTYSTIVYQNIELYKYIKESKSDCRVHILASVYYELMIQYGDSFHI